jgi:hypothetical protein
MIIIDPIIEMRERQASILQEVQQDQLALAATKQRSWRLRLADALVLVAQRLDSSLPSRSSNKKVRQH